MHVIKSILVLDRVMHPAQWTDFDDLYVIRRVSAQAIAFGVTFILLPVLRVKSPKTRVIYSL